MKIVTVIKFAGGIRMELILNYDNNTYNLNLERNIIIFGKNNVYKNKFFNELSTSLIKGKKNISIDGKSIDQDNFNIIDINEETDFCHEFKFTKNNALRQLIYNDVSERINGKRMINYANEIFDIIDQKINKLLEKNINKKNENNITFEIEIPDINSIIGRFTNIYIDDILLTDNTVSKSMKRLLLYRLYFLEIKKNSDKQTIVIINNFDAYLNADETIHILNEINSLSSDRCHFILNSCNNIFEYLNLRYYNVYKITNELISLDKIDTAIKTFLIKREYKNRNENFYEFYNNNEHLICEDEIKNIKSNLFNYKPHIIGKILNSDSIKLYFSKPNNINQEFIILENTEEKILYEEICSKFIDQQKNI